MPDHSPNFHTDQTGTPVMCCPLAWWCDDCGNLRHMAEDPDNVLTGVTVCWPCTHTRALDRAQLPTTHHHA